MSHEVVITRQGALAVRCLEAGEIMHPGVGPLVEAEALYVRQSRLEERLRATPSAPLVVFDVGLGAGSNALAAWAASERAPHDVARLELVSFERDLGAFELALAHGEAFGFSEATARAARELLDHRVYETPRSTWRLVHGDVMETLPRELRHADVVFWDPFSPRANPDLWTVQAFATMRAVAGPRCTLYTYSASTAVRVALLLGGWAVGFGAAIGSKSHTTAAAVDRSDLERPLDRRWLGKLAQPNVPMPRDAPADTAARVGALPQFR